MKSVFIMTLLFGSIFSNSHADQFIDAYQATCDPSVGYFSFHTITNSDLASDISSTIPALDSLIKKPYQCNLLGTGVFSKNPNRMIEISIENFMPAHERGECATRDQFTLVLKENGSEKLRFSPYGGNRCTDAETHFIEITPFSGRDCAISKQNKVTNGSIECTQIEK